MGRGRHRRGCRKSTAAARRRSRRCSARWLCSASTKSHLGGGGSGGGAWTGRQWFFANGSVEAVVSFDLEGKPGDVTEGDASDRTDLGAAFATLRDGPSADSDLSRRGR